MKQLQVIYGDYKITIPRFSWVYKSMPVILALGQAETGESQVQSLHSEILSQKKQEKMEERCSDIHLHTCNTKGSQVHT